MTCPSGRRCNTRNVVWCNSQRGFKSHRHRHVAGPLLPFVHKGGRGLRFARHQLITHMSPINLPIAETSRDTALLRRRSGHPPTTLNHASSVSKAACPVFSAPPSYSPQMTFQGTPSAPPTEDPRSSAVLKVVLCFIDQRWRASNAKGPEDRNSDRGCIHAYSPTRPWVTWGPSLPSALSSALQRFDHHQPATAKDGGFITAMGAYFQ